MYDISYISFLSGTMSLELVFILLRARSNARAYFASVSRLFHRRASISHALTSALASKISENLGAVFENFMSFFQG